MSFDTRAAREAVERIPGAPECSDLAVLAALVHVDLRDACDEVDRLRAALAECVIDMGEVLDRGYGSVYLAARRERARVALGEQP